MRTLTIHAYGTNACDKNPSFPYYPTIPHLLSLTASRSLLNGFTSSWPQPTVTGRASGSTRWARSRATARPGVSDTMASALWVMDALFSLARSGVDGVNLHSYPGSDNGLFDFTQTDGRWQATVHPLYYGALMFAQAAPAGSRLLQIATGRPGPDPRLGHDATASDVVRVLLINDSLSATSRSVVHAPAGYGSSTASLERLQRTGSLGHARDHAGRAAVRHDLDGRAPRAAAAHRLAALGGLHRHAAREQRRAAGLSPGPRADADRRGRADIREAPLFGVPFPRITRRAARFAGSRTCREEEGLRSLRLSGLVVALVAVGVIGAGGGTAQAASCPWMNTALSSDARAEMLLGAMSLPDKIAMVHQAYPQDTHYGAAGWIPANASLCIPDLVLNDAGEGVGDQQVGRHGVSGPDRAGLELGSGAAVPDGRRARPGGGRQGDQRPAGPRHRDRSACR